MIFIVLLFLFFLLYIFPLLRCIALHPVSSFGYFVVDVFLYLLHRVMNLCPYGYIRAYTGLFGQGKTLSAVHFCARLYNRYNNKKVWCSRRRKFVVQKVHIISNVDLKTVPYEQFLSLKQLVYVAENMEEQDNLNNTLTVTIALADELSVQLNSRSFKNNVDALFLNTLLTCRHYHMGLVYTAQRFVQVDALLRQVTSVVIECNKFFRFQSQSYYNAWDLENAGTPTMVKPLRRSCWFVRNRDYRAYDTFATVGNLSKACATGDMLTSEEILALQCNNVPNMDAVERPAKRFVKRFKKK